MTTTNRAVTALLVATFAVGLAAPATAVVVPPEPTTTSVSTSEPSPALTEGRAYCACQGLPYEPLWIQ
jgi:hypothetical protein